MITSVLARSLLRPHRQPLCKNPSDYGMKYQDVEFLAEDSVGIKGWLIPGTKKKLIIMTHPMPFTRYGFSVKHQGMFKASDIEVELLNTAKQLNKAGYTVLTFDFRNHGKSGKGNKGFTGVGCHEWQDVVAALGYAATDPVLKEMDIGFVSHCMGANATIIAMSKAKDAFSRVKCLVAIQPVSMNVLVPRMVKDAFPLFSRFAENIDKKVKKKLHLSLADMSPKKYVKDITVPVLYVQVKKDPWTEPSDVESFFNETTSPKELFWIEGDKRRFDGYNYFGEKPEKLLAFLEKNL
jgi:uncharacterized protein